MLTREQPFPDFDLMDHRGLQTTKGDLLGHWTVVYFYMKDYSVICTRLAKDFTDLIRKFKARGCEVWGVSPDSPKTHANFLAKNRLGVSLLSDGRRQLARLCGVWGPKVFHGRQLVGTRRATFIVDPEAVVQGVLTGVLPQAHAFQALETLAAIQKIWKGGQ
jgi:peroxiredoxin Q/BCP